MGHSNRPTLHHRPRMAVVAAFICLTLASPAAAQPSPSPAPPTAEDIAAAYVASVRLERERALARVEQALAALGPEGLPDRLAADPRPQAPELPTFTVTVHGCAPAAPGEVGHVCHYGYVVTDPVQGVSYPGPYLVVGHLFPGPEGLLVRELPPTPRALRTGGALGRPARRAPPRPPAPPAE